MYDVAIVGARVAGSALAMLLARAGLSVVVLDRARFPSDTVSTHQLQVPGAALLAKWGLLERLQATGAPPTRTVTFETAGGTRLEGQYPQVGGADAVYSPRRTLFDHLLVEAARTDGAEVREGSRVEEVLPAEGSVRVRSRRRAGGTVTDVARFVVGADGKHSTVARSVGARTTREHPPSTLASYTYWSGVELDRGWMVTGHRRVAAAWRTNDDLVVTYVGMPLGELDTYRSDPEAELTSSLKGLGELGERVLGGHRVERIRATTDVPTAVRQSWGPGWALAGDAGLVLDPITGQGMGHALRDADLLSQALVDGLGGARPLGSALRAYTDERDRGTRDMIDFTLEVARLREPSATSEALFEGLAGRREATDRFIAGLAGIVPMSEVLAPRRLVGLIGPAAFWRVATARRREQTSRRRSGIRDASSTQ